MTLVRKLIQGAVVLPLTGVLLSIIGYLGLVPEYFTISQYRNDITSKIENPEDRLLITSLYDESKSLFILSVVLQRIKSERDEKY